MDRVMEKVSIDPDTDCWLFTGSLIWSGYGSAGFGGKTYLTHRLTYQFWIGPIPAGMELHHLCGRRHCCNPDHLQPVSHREHTGGKRAFCRRGHPLATENAYESPSGRRYCKTCAQASRKRGARKQRNA